MSDANRPEPWTHRALTAALLVLGVLVMALLYALVSQSVFSQEVASGQAASGQAASGQAASGQAASGQAASHVAASQSAASAETGPRASEEADEAPRAGLPRAGSPQAASSSGEIIQVGVRNGCGKPGLAADLRDYLVESGFDVVEVGNYSAFDLDSSRVVDRVGNLRAARRVAAALGIPRRRVRQDLSSEYYLDASVLIGRDYQTLAPFNHADDAPAR